MNGWYQIKNMKMKVRVWLETNKKTYISVIVVYAMVRYAKMHELEIYMYNDTRVRDFGLKFNELY